MFFRNRKFLISRLALILVFVAGISGMMFAHPVQASTLIVTNTNDSGTGSLRQAVINAVPGDTITFDPSLAGSTISLTSEINLDKDLTIDASDLDPTVELSGNLASRIFYISSNTTITLQSLSFKDGRSTSSGGAIYNDGNLTVINSTFSNNSTTGAGGAIHNNDGLTLNVSNSTFINNSAQSGGAIYLHQSPFINDVSSNMENNTFVGNQANMSGGTGGAIYSNIDNSFGNDTVFILSNNTFSGNGAYSGGNLYNMGSMSFHNNIFANNTGGGDCYSMGSITPIIVYGLNNLIEDGVPCSQGTFTSGDPLLGPLTDNGGPTMTMALLPGSPAIDAGTANCVSTDQRGITRPQGAACEIGAYEYEYQTVIYHVKWDAGGANNGTSWTDAFTDLQSALAAASTGDQIWVAAGTYKPTTGIARTASFTLKNGVAIYGGFAGTETLLSQRNPEANVTILSGDIGVLSDTSDNSYHIVIGSNTNNSAVLNGFTVTGGNANQEQLDKGGGMLNILGNPTVSNVVFSDNYAGLGGGMFNGGDGNLPPSPVGSNPILTNVTFTGNSALEGGGMENMNYSNPTLTNVVFSNNTAVRSGGGMLNNSFNNPILTNVTFSGNTASWGGGIGNWAYNNPVLNNVTFSGNSAEWGGGMGNYQSSPVLTNVTFSGNSVTTYGGAISNENNSSPILTNVTISGNSAVTYGGGVYNDYNGGVIRNSILYGNTGGDIFGGSGSLVMSYSITQGSYPGTGNINADPHLGPLQNNGGFTQTMVVLAGSPAIDAGNDAICPPTDQREISRPQGSHCDIGAYEARHYMISGNAGAPGVILSYADTIFGVACVTLPDGSISCTPPQPVPASKYHYVTSDQDGNYSLQMPEGWFGSVVPSKPGYTFSPVKRTYSDLAGDQASQDFTASIVDSVLPPDAGSTRRVVPADAVPADNPLNFEYLDISGNGRYVAYVSNSPDLVPDDSNQRSDVFVWDRLTDTTQRISVNSGGEEANDHSFFPSLSKDGRYVAFESWATNLDTACTWGRNVFVHDMQTGMTICASVNAIGLQGSDTSDRPKISADGRYVVYKSFANNLVSGDTNNQWDVFVFDILNRTTVRASVSSTGVQGNSYSENAAISGDGRYVAFWSNASTLVASDTNGSYDIFVRDMLNGTTSRVSVHSSGVQGNGASFRPAISEDGRFVAFASHATNIVDGDTNASTDVFVHDTQTATTSRVSLSSNNAQGNGISTFPTISADGRFVVFDSAASNLVSNDTGVWTDIFVRDRLTNRTTRVSVATDGSQADNESLNASMSSDGRYVVFESRATNLASPMVPNRYSDAYLHENGFTISGNAGVAAATLTYVDGSIKTMTADANGDYAFTVSYNWSGTVTPSKNGFTFAPAFRNYANVLMDQTGNDYIATPTVLTLVLQPNGATGVDSYIYSGSKNANFGNAVEMGVGEINNANNRIARGLIKFDLSSIPANATINSATLSLWTNADLSSTDRTIRVYRLKTAFNETQATWTIAATGTSWQIAGASGANDRETSAIGSVTILNNEALNSEKQLVLAPDKIQELVNGTFVNKGFILVADTESNDRFDYKTSDSPSATQRPQLVIQYTVPSGTPSNTPTATHTSAPTNTSTTTSTPLPTNTPTATLTATFTATPTNQPTNTSTWTPTVTVTATRTFTPTATLTKTATPTFTPTVPTPHPPTITFTPTFTPTTSSGFPITIVRDNFNRANGAIGTSWSGYPAAFTIASNQLDVTATGSNTFLLWNAASFGTDQEAYVTLTQLDTTATSEHRLILKSQSSKNVTAGQISVRYDAVGQTVQVWTYHPLQGWVQYGANIPVTFANGDQLGARARPDGTVEIYRNGTLLGTRSITAWPFYANGGYIGLWLVNAPGALLDNFGGGTR